VTGELRAPTLDDVERLADLVNRDAEELYGEQDETPESMRLWLTGPGLDPAADSRILVVDGVVRGYVDLDAHPEPTWWIDLRVPPSEGEGIREPLMDWVEGEAERRAAGKAGAVARFFVADGDGPTKSALEERGYRVIRSSYRMRIDYGDQELAEPVWPEGVVVRPATAEDAQLAYETHQETFEDSWEHEREPFEEWSHWMTGYESFDPSLWFVAEAGGEPAAVCLCRLNEGDERLGFVRVLGVRRDWRKQGLGRALLLHAFHEFRRRGIDSVALGVDAESLTGAHKLYESVGMRVVRLNRIYEKELGAGTV
jgi:mycothiol synthase